MALVAAAAVTVAACTAPSPGPATTSRGAPGPRLEGLATSRPFRMGFTTWPYAFDAEAVDWTWETIAAHGDLVTLHLDHGVPWPEAAAGDPFPAAVEADLDDAARRAAAFETVYVSATPQDTDRASIARYWGDAGTQAPLPPGWDARALDDPEVIDAYLAYCRRLLDRLHPDFFAYGIEVNAGFRPGSDAHRRLLGLAAAVYPALKADYPDTAVFLTFQIGSWEATAEEAVAITESLLPYTDLVGISAYPYLDFADPLRPEARPGPVEDWMGPLAALGKPIAVTETGYAAEPLVVPDLGIDTVSTPDWQADYVADLLTTAARHDARFVTYWEVRDYDRAFEFLLDAGTDPALAAIWRDIGLVDGDGRPRPALGIWDAWLALPVG